MSKVLDLSLFVKQTLDITMPDGDILHIKKPSQAMVIKLMAFQEVEEDKAFEALDELCLLVLNNNKEGKTFTADWLNDNFDWVMKSAVVKAFSEFIQELQSNPNL